MSLQLRLQFFITPFNPDNYNIATLGPLSHPYSRTQCNREEVVSKVFLSMRKYRLYTAPSQWTFLSILLA